MSSAKFKKEFKDFDCARDFKLAHQVLCIQEFNFENESIVGYVDMLFHPLVPDLRKVKINCKQCSIHRVVVNGVWEADVSYNDPILEICPNDNKLRTFDYFQACHSAAVLAVDADSGNGELSVKLPDDFLPAILEMKPFHVMIEFSLERPQGGIKFVVPDTDGTLLDRGAHLFTCGRENSSRLWFPCIDCFSEVCTWKLEFTVSMYMVAVSVGDLVETIYTSDLRRKTYHYYMSVPTAAPNIAVAVGPFEIFVDPNMHEVTHFCLPRLLPLLKHTTSFFHEVIEFYEETLSTRFPYTCYKQVFVDMAYSDIAPYASMTICSLYLLTNKRVIDQTPVTRQLLAQAVAQQFFGCFISMNSWCDAWLPKGLATYLCSHYRSKSFGNNALRYSIAKDMREVCDHEQQVGPVVLDPSVVRDVALYLPMKSPHTTSPIYSAIYEKKAHLIMRMLALKIGPVFMFQVLNKLLTLASNASKMKFSANAWSNMLISTSSFLKCISSVTGKDCGTFVEQWVHQGGVARFVGSFIFNRKRNVVEIELRQDWTAKGTMKYAGPLTIMIQELDGTFPHTFMIEENKTRFEITCHSKSRRQKKKKIPLSTNEEVEMNLDDTDPDSPVLWLRVDPEITILRHVKLEQPDFMWQYLLRYERCVTSQHEAICALEQFPTPKSRNALMTVIDDSKMFYLVRIDAAKCLTKVANAMAETWGGPPAMMSLFHKMFGSRACETIVRQNDFSNFQQYYVQKAIPVAMAGLRTVHNICPSDVSEFLLRLIEFNENSKNKFDDGYYRAALVDALAATVTPAVTPVTVTGYVPSSDCLATETKSVLEEVTLYMNMEKLLPCFHLAVTVSCLKAFSTLQLLGHLPPVPGIFKSYASEGHILGVRLAALEALVSYAATESSSEILTWLLDLVENDAEPFVRFHVIKMLTAKPPYSKRENSLMSAELQDRLWNMMNSKFAYDSRLRCAVVDLYFVLFGKSRPSIQSSEDMMYDTPFMKSEDSRGSLHGKRRNYSPSLPYEMKVPDFSSEVKVESSYQNEDDNMMKLKLHIGGPGSPHSGSSRSSSPAKFPFLHQPFGGPSFSLIDEVKKYPVNVPFSSSDIPQSPSYSIDSSDAVPKAAMEVIVKDDAKDEDNSLELSESSHSFLSAPSSPEYDPHDFERSSSPKPRPSRKLFGGSAFPFAAEPPGLRLGSSALGSSSSISSPMPAFASGTSSWLPSLSSAVSGFTGLTGSGLSEPKLSVSGNFRDKGGDLQMKPEERKRKRSTSGSRPLNLSSYRASSSNSSGSSPTFHRESSPDDLI